MIVAVPNRVDGNCILARYGFSVFREEAVDRGVAFFGAFAFFSS